MNRLKILTVTSLVMVSFAASAVASDRMGDRYIWGDAKATTTSLHAINVERVFDLMERRRQNVPLQFRGASSPEIYKKYAPSVVLVLTNEGSGSGSIIDEEGTILTAWHVIDGYKEVGIVFKPDAYGAAEDRDDYVVADVKKVDEIRDLALLKLRKTPKGKVPIKLGKQDEIVVGAEAHAIGHPNGQTWTYTQGKISQYRKQYDWFTGMGVQHQADIVQTQTPINPGNSGGPLLSAEGSLIGVNSFIADGEGLNFAVALEEVKRFIASNKKYVRAKEVEQEEGECAVKALSEKREEKKKLQIITMDINCDKKADGVVLVPDDESKPIKFLMDKNNNGKIDTIVVDENRDGEWDFSLWDVNSDEQPDLLGLHGDGTLRPSSFKPYG
jgi:S1-C subfamily serine protease